MTALVKHKIAVKNPPGFITFALEAWVTLLYQWVICVEKQGTPCFNNSIGTAYIHGRVAEASSIKTIVILEYTCK